ncbi:SIR2 family protein [Clostridium tyrobutyricum]|uniref:SIR2 family protein n=1 Tax=Clostridium tyrobutyricum TaxID=1519 RepID=UPI001C385C9D|nr:SIR2 family protein [Clostridium tyrobutyricum]MBV4447911.1 SIR2 family protein [Clostridium tyrobutyricum]
MDVKVFIKKYSEAIQLGNAAVFAGAGLSMPSGFISWKKLLEPLAEEIGLSMDKEHDYLAVAQYYYNQKKTRTGINTAIYDAFTSATCENMNLNIITRLPISTYWTTNYDHLLEDELNANNRKVDIKITKENFTMNMKDVSATVYKMHGDAQFPDETVLIKDDYETYGMKRDVFTTVLKGHLLSKTFLFIGFSFEDPNLNSILAWIKSLLGNNVKEHYCLFKSVYKYTGEKDEDFAYRKAKQDLIVDDLRRYGIEAILLESYDNIPNVLEKIETQCNLRNLFLSGSISVRTTSWTIKQAEEFAKILSNRLVAEKVYITSGYGLGIGSAVITGVLNEVKSKKYAHFDDYLKLYPFPQPRVGEDFRAMWHDYRREMMANCGVVIFMFGNKVDDNGECVIANGMIDEYEIAKAKQAILIPIASTGEASEQIYNKMFSEKTRYPYLEEYWGLLRTEKSPERLAKVIIKIISSISVY